jgi:hypothetical protein
MGLELGPRNDPQLEDYLAVRCCPAVEMQKRPSYGSASCPASLSHPPLFILSQPCSGDSVDPKEEPYLSMALLFYYQVGLSRERKIFELFKFGGPLNCHQASQPLSSLLQDSVSLSA